MSLHALANASSHLQNCTKARLALTSLPNSKWILAVALAMQRDGFLSTVTRAGPRPPEILTATSHPAAAHMTESQVRFEGLRIRDGSKRTLIRGSSRGMSTSASKDVEGKTADEEERPQNDGIKLVGSGQDPMASSLPEHEEHKHKFANTLDPLDPMNLPASHPDTALMTKGNVATRRLWIGLKYWKEMPVLKEMKMVSKPKQKICLGYRELRNVVLGKGEGYVKPLSRVGECLYVSTDRGVLESREAVEKKLGGMVLCRVL